MLILNIAGVKAVGVESLSALLVGVTGVDRCLTEERSLNRSSSYLTVLDGHVSSDEARQCKGHKPQMKREFWLLKTYFYGHQGHRHSADPVGKNAHLLFVEAQGARRSSQASCAAVGILASPCKFVVHT